MNSGKAVTSMQEKKKKGKALIPTFLNVADAKNMYMLSRNTDERFSGANEIKSRFHHNKVL